jgi:DNA-binding SARP family transcriptional activator
MLHVLVVLGTLRDDRANVSCAGPVEALEPRADGAGEFMVGERPDFRVLGQLTISRAGQPITIKGTKPRAVLAYLLINRGRLVTTTALVDELWRGRPPATPNNTVQTYIRQLRDMLEPDRRSGWECRILRTIPGGYQLDVQPGDVDSAVFEQLLEQGRQALRDNSSENARELLRTGLAMWQGAAFAGLQEFATAAQEADRLEQLRLDAIELRVQSDLELGRCEDVVDELTELVRRHPVRESLVGHLMLALYRCERQSESLAAYEATRKRLSDELGVDPHVSLQKLHQQVLRQDPALHQARQDQAQAPAEKPSTPANDTKSRRRLGRRAVTTAAPALVIVATAGIVVLQSWSATSGTPVTPSPSQSPAPAIFNEFDLAVSPGMGYDLDIPTGRPTDWHSTNNPRSPDYSYLDLYRTSAKAPRDHLSGVDLGNTNEFNVVQRVNNDDPITICRSLATHGGGNAPLELLGPGSRVCLRTHEDRWAMVTITKMPSDRTAIVLLHVAVLQK